MRIANAVFAVMFTLAVLVQWNDPDPLRWSAMYLAALAACVAWELRRLPRFVPAIVGAVALVWAGVIAMAMRVTAPLGEALTDWQMHAGGSEELRESLGLVLIAIWMAALTARPR